VLQSAKPLSRQMGEVLTHPLRYKCLILLTEKVASPAELARDLGVDVSDLSYHVRVLRECNAIELVESIPGPTAVQHFYRAAHRAELDDEAYLRMTIDERIAAGRVTAQMIFADVASSMETGVFGERFNHHISRFPLTVDEEGWEELTDIYARALEETYEVTKRTALRMAENPDAARVQTRVATLLFEMPPKDRAPGAANPAPPPAPEEA
jgi:DNA-binding transcriptional ArsR family regulator